MNFSPVTAITFDCYGTLIDWEAGILTRPPHATRQA